MKTYILIFLFLAVGSGFSQNYLTNAQVFNFNVGDTIQTLTHSNNASGVLFTTRVTLQKNIYGNDSIIYVTKVNAFTGFPPWHPSYPGTLNTSTITEVIKNLSSPMGVFYPAPSDITSYNDNVSIDPNNCNHSVMEHTGVSSATFEANYYFGWAIEGAGNYYYTYSNAKSTPSYVVTCELQYLHKTGQQPCKTYYATGLTDNKIEKDLPLFPNPNNGCFQLTTRGKCGQVTIYDSQGKQVYFNRADEKKNITIDISGVIQRGVYLVLFKETDTGVRYYSRFIIE